MITLKVDAGDLKALTARLRQQADGKELRKELVRNLRSAMAPAVSDARGAAMGLPGGHVAADGQPLRAAIAASIVPEVRAGGKTPGVRVKAKKSRMPRGFALAARRMNRGRGWRHPVFGRASVSVHQEGLPGWFDNVFKGRKPAFRMAVIKAMENTAKKITRR